MVNQLSPHINPADVPPAAFVITVASLFDKQVRLRPKATAVLDGNSSWTFSEVDRRVNRWCRLLESRGLTRGRRFAILSENRHEYLELELAAARLGAIAACLNGRLTTHELEHCMQLADPMTLVVSPAFEEVVARCNVADGDLLVLGDALEQALLAQPDDVPPTGAVDPEDGLVILYTSGTTGLPKGALISHRAMVARMAVFVQITGATQQDAFLAWAPLFHMASTDHSLITLLLGGSVIIADGPDLDVFSSALSEHTISWLVAIPGMIERLIDHLRNARLTIKGVRTVGAMPDLVPRQQLAELTALLDAPYLNTFGSTEAGLVPACGNTLPPGQVPTSLSKCESPYCEVRLVDEDELEVPDDTPGEMLIRGPTLFSGYWGAHSENRTDFRGGWFHSGDVFVRHADRSLDFVDRSKYMIKTGGENLYPAEIEIHLLSHPCVADAVVVRRPDDVWGEIPVAFVALVRPGLEIAEIVEYLRGKLASYKVPKEVRFVNESDFPRSTTGKIQRHEVEAWLQN